MKRSPPDSSDPVTRPSGEDPEALSPPLLGAALSQGPEVASDVSRGLATLDQEDREQSRLIQSLLLTLRQFFGGVSSLFGGVTDPRRHPKCRYPLPTLFFIGLLMFVCRLGARRQIALQLRNRRSTDKMNALFGVDRVPHGDTLNRTFANLDLDESQEIVTGMVARLIRGKVLDDARLCGCIVVAIDGTGTLTFKERHCPNCLTRTQGAQTTYYHNVLEAKVVTPLGFSSSLMTEFIENEAPNPSQQDCELKAFYRLAERLYKRFPRLRILLTLDGLFAGGPTFALCERYGWKWIISLKDGDLKSVHEEFESLSPMQLENSLNDLTGRDAKVRQEYRWVTDIRTVDTEGRAHLLSVLQCIETEPRARALTGARVTQFKWITHVKLAQHRVVEPATNGGRIRWKIENEGFKVRKTGGYGLEHATSENPTAAKVFYFLLQVAHIVFQLLEKGSLLKKAFPKGFGSLKNLADRILEAWRNVRHLTREALAQLFARRIQIRFDTS